MKFNPEQLAAIGAREGYWVTLATAGSGKTATLVERIKQLFSEGARVEDVLALTFTTEAAAEMERRTGVKVPKSEKSGFRTFHSFGFRMIREEFRLLPYGLSTAPMPEPQVLSRMLSDCMKDNGLSKQKFKEVRAFISKMKHQRVKPNDSLPQAPEEAFAYVYGAYQKRLREGAMLDFDDMIVESVWLLENHKALRDRWQFKWVLCDEGQDTDNLQFRMLQLISEKHKNVFCVGDFCQALYQFRGAHPENLLKFDSWFPGSKTLVLPLNYRSTPEIVALCKASAPVRNELTENMRTENPSGVPVEYRLYAGAEDEAEAVLALAQSNPGGCAVLARTNQQLALFETFCTERGVKFHLLGNSGFWHQSEVKSVVNLAGFVVSGREPSKYSEELVAPLRWRLRSADAASAVKSIIDSSGLIGLYGNTEYEDKDNYALLNLLSLGTIAKRFSTLREFLAHAQKASHASRKSKNALTLSTVHQAKGLEWPNVFVVGVQQGKLPHERGDLEEEKRIFFVAISRAAKRLRISYSGPPSEFIKPFLKFQPAAPKYAQETLTGQTSLFA